MMHSIRLALHVVQKVMYTILSGECEYAAMRCAGHTLSERVKAKRKSTRKKDRSLEKPSHQLSLLQ